MINDVFMKNRITENLVRATIVSMHWERIFLHIDIKVEMEKTASLEDSFVFYSVDSQGKAQILWEQKELSDGRIRLLANISNTGEGRAVPMGSYYLYACQGEEILARCTVAPEFIPQLENISRSFLYYNRHYGYHVNFYVLEGEDELPLMMHILNGKEITMDAKTNGQIWKEILSESFILFRKNIGRMFWKSYYRFYTKCYQKKKHRILFMTEQTDKLGTNLTSVMDRISERGLDEKYTILTSARPYTCVKQTKASMAKLLRTLAGCEMIFVDDHVPIFDWLKIKDSTKIVQLWHAGAGFKSSGYSRWGHTGCPAPVSCHRQYTYGIAGSKHIGIFFAEVFGINEEQILPTGMPRMDEYLNPQYQERKRKELYEEFPACKGKKVILFAPTYRGKNHADASYPYHLIDFERLAKFCGEEYMVLFKMHPWVQSGVPIPEKYKDRFMDVGQYPNINDLFYFTEILITDYSSNIFEYSLMRKPMLFFAFDKVQYSFSRGFHRDYEEAAPGKVCYSFDELMTALEQGDFAYEKVEEYIEKHFDYIDSNASDRVIDWTILGKLPKEIQQAIDRRNADMRRMHQLDFTGLNDFSIEKKEER